LPEAETVALSAKKEANYRRLLPDGGIVAAGLHECIQRIHAAGIRTAVATTLPRESVDFVLDFLELSEAFEVVVTGNDVTRGKPDPEIYVTVLDALGCHPEEVVAFEDSPQGVTAARAAGIRTIGVLPEYSAEVLERCGAGECIEGFEGVVVH
jgi:beta-phosphoglucomutase